MTPHIKSDIPAYINGDLTETRRQQLEAHVEECSACRHLLNKAKSKQARVKRAALKSAVPDRVPNLLLTRLGKQVGISPRANGTPWGLLTLLAIVLAAGGWWIRRAHFNALARTHSSLAEMSEPAASTATVAGFDVSASSPAALRTNGEPAANAPEAAAMSWAAAFSAIHEPRQVVLRSREAWRALWKEMGEDSQAPRVNFEDEIIVGIFAGEHPDARYEVHFSTPHDQVEGFMIPYEVSRSSQPHEGPSPAYPYSLKVIPRTAKRVRFALETP
jgi:anti-sigma factor RsiW